MDAEKEFISAEGSVKNLNLIYTTYIYTLLILGKKRKESQKEVKPTGLATKKKLPSSPFAQGLDPPLKTV